ncbi:hypothetical protein ACIREO_27765 [Streptomyces sp. NPDC102441]|uniref:hypothetical protein n=1 Tax=Streptomyces sp. NPDC102441 TaxID=3366176 RepID=UPI0038069C23
MADSLREFADEGVGTAGLSTLLAGAETAATRIAFKRILKEMAEAAVSEIVALTEPAVAAIENIVADLAIQTALNVTGVQDGYDAGRTKQAGKDGLRINSAGGRARSAVVPPDTAWARMSSSPRWTSGVRAATDCGLPHRGERVFRVPERSGATARRDRGA